MARKGWKIILPKGVNEEEIAGYCKLCREESRRLGKPSPRAMDCWKVIIEVEAGKVGGVLGVVENIVSGCRECWAEYRVRGDNAVFIIVVRGWKLMWDIRGKLVEELYARRVIDKPYLPYRRGGSYYEPDYGPWRRWSLSYYPEHLSLHDPSSASIVCPNDGALMEYTGKGFRCMFCGLYIPETVLYEAVENGEAEYAPRQGAHKGRVYRVRYGGSGRFIVERVC